MIINVFINSKDKNTYLKLQRNEMWITLVSIQGVSKKSTPFQIQISHHVLYYLTTLILQVYKEYLI